MNDFGRQVDLQRRFDDFAKLHESLSSVPGISLPALPPKNMFGGNDPKVVDERRPLLEKLVKECVGNEKVLSDQHDHLFKFLEISPAGVSVIKFLSPSTRAESLPKLVELLKPDAVDNYRLFNESVVRVLLHLLTTSSDNKTIITSLDVLQFILSRAHSHPLANTVDIQQVFVTLNGIGIVWNLLTGKPDFRENCRRVLSSLITSNSGKIEKYESLILNFFKAQNGLSQLFASISNNPTESLLHEIVAKLIWFGLSAEVQAVVANHPQGLALLGRLFSSPDSNARCLSGLTLSVLVTSGALDSSKTDRAVDGVQSILASLITCATDSPTQPFLSSLCRGSSNGLGRILFCVEHGTSPMSDFCSFVLLNAELPIETIINNGIVTVVESALLANRPDSELGMNCARFLFRLFHSANRLPSSRSDGRIADLLARVREGLLAYTKSSRKQIHSEHKQFGEFQKSTIKIQCGQIKAKVVEQIDFSSFQQGVVEYESNRAALEAAVLKNESQIGDLGIALSASDEQAWGAVSGDLVKEWNQSVLGMASVYDRVAALKTALREKEAEAKSAQADSVNMQQIVSKMREEITLVDSKAEEFRKESSRFSSASAGAVDPDAMLAKARECEKQAKDEIAKREALRQSQDSLEAQLEGARQIIVRAETSASETRKTIAETMLAVAEGERMHAELEGRFKAELAKAVEAWNANLSKSRDQLAAVGGILKSFDSINKMMATENDQKDVLVGIIGELVVKLQRLQANLGG